MKSKNILKMVATLSFAGFAFSTVLTSCDIGGNAGVNSSTGSQVSTTESTSSVDTAAEDSSDSSAAVEETVYYTVAFNTGEGASKIATREVVEGSSVTRPTDPTREGYVFLGWYDGYSEYDFDNAVNENVLLTASWGRQYTITFDSNGGSAVGKISTAEGYTFDKPDDPTNGDKSFKGWYTADEKAYDWKSEATADLTLKAKWVPTYTVNYDYDNGQAAYTEKVPEGDLIKEANPKKTGKVFAGWYYTEGSEEKLFDAEAAVTKNYNLKAHWVTGYTITFDSDGGSDVEEQIVGEGFKVVKPEDPTNEGMSFKCWTYKYQPFDFSTEITEDITLIAEWEVSHKVTFDMSGGDEIKAQYVNDGTLLEAVTPVKAGSNFIEWQDKDTGDVFDPATTPVVDDMTLIAVWECYLNYGSLTSTSAVTIPGVKGTVTKYMQITGVTPAAPKVVTIPRMIDGLYVYNISATFLQNNDTVEKVVLPNTLGKTTAGVQYSTAPYAFSTATALKEIELVDPIMEASCLFTYDGCLYYRSINASYDYGYYATMVVVPYQKTTVTLDVGCTSILSTIGGTTGDDYWNYYQPGSYGIMATNVQQFILQPDRNTYGTYFVETEPYMLWTMSSAGAYTLTYVAPGYSGKIALPDFVNGNMFGSDTYPYYYNKWPNITGFEASGTGLTFEIDGLIYARTTLTSKDYIIIGVADYSRTEQCEILKGVEDEDVTVTWNAGVFAHSHFSSIKLCKPSHLLNYYAATGNYHQYLTFYSTSTKHGLRVLDENDAKTNAVLVPADGYSKMDYKDIVGSSTTYNFGETMVSQNMTSQYAVVFNVGNSGAEQTIVVGDTGKPQIIKEADIPVPQAEGYKFLAWCTTNSFKAGQVYTDYLFDFTKEIGSDTTVYAIFELDAKFDLVNGYEDSIDTVNTYKVILGSVDSFTAIKPDCDPLSDDGSMFLKWTTKPYLNSYYVNTGTTYDVTFNGQALASKITIYACFVYTFHVDPGEGNFLYEYYANGYVAYGGVWYAIGNPSSPSTYTAALYYDVETGERYYDAPATNAPLTGDDPNAPKWVKRVYNNLNLTTKFGMYAYLYWNLPSASSSTTISLSQEVEVGDSLPLEIVPYKSIPNGYEFACWVEAESVADKLTGLSTYWPKVPYTVIDENYVFTGASNYQYCVALWRKIGDTSNTLYGCAGKTYDFTGVKLPNYKTATQA